MPRLSDYIQQRELLPAGQYVFKVTDVDFLEDDSKEHPTIQIKGTVNGSTYVIFRYQHPNLRWQTAADLLASGVSIDTVDSDDQASIVTAYQQLKGRSLTVNVKIRQSAGYEDKNDWKIKGEADGVSSGSV